MNCPHCGKAVAFGQGDLFRDKLVKVEAGQLRLPSGGKARQVKGQCSECGGEKKRDRNWEFSDALRRHRVAAHDIDFLTLGGSCIGLVLECTRPDDDHVHCPEAYLPKVDARRLLDNSKGNNADHLTCEIAKTLGCSAILVLFEPDIDVNDDSPIWWRYLDQDKWSARIKSKDFFASLRNQVQRKREKAKQQPTRR